MTPPRSSTPSLDAMLESTREQFDRTFADRLRQADAAGLRNRRQRAAAPEEPATEPHAEADSDIDAVLNRRFGADWSAELVETQVTGNTLSALYRLTVDGRSALEFGDAPADGNREAALEAARRSALARAADALAHGAQPSAATTDPAPLRTPASPTTTGPRAAPAPSGALDALALDRIEAAWRQIRKEAGNVLAQAAIAEPARQKAAETATLTDARGATLIGRPVPAVADLARNRSRDLRPGDVFLAGDPYAGVQAGTWTAIVPVFAAETGGDPVGFSAATAPMAGSAGAVPGSAPNGARSVYGEGLRIPPIRIFDDGQASSAALDLMLNNIPESGAAHGDLRALVEAAQAGERGIADLCVRFGAESYRQACAAALERTGRALRRIVAEHLPEEPKSFEDRIDSDGCGNGPFTLKLAVWREGEQAFFDWTGTAAQAEGPVNLLLDDTVFAHIAAGLLVRTFDPEIAVNDGVLAPLRITLPPGSLLHPRFPAPLGNGAQTLARVYDVLNGALGQFAGAAGAAAGYGSSPQLVFTGEDSRGRAVSLTDRLFGGAPARSGRDGGDGRSLSAGARSRPAEQLESNFSVTVESVTAIADSGGAGAHRGGCGVEKVYRFRTAGTLSLRDEREQSQPWGRNGGEAGACSEKIVVRTDGSREQPGSKAGGVRVAPGDRLIFRTAGGGGWGNPLDRSPEQVQKDVRRGLVSTAGARDRYGVVVAGSPAACTVDRNATQELRETLGRSRGRSGGGSAR
ncbi:MAG: hydantoinase B/oxoprolinase family protein [Rhodospirillaceae bacterium]|nr:hydantoinase B/oxoprolinase family protein [Rhodospirillaceae bacterium]MDE0620005.1 hydantoinase B/oxoprolinase family protein [Rhodospirillaceae bacterium]